MELLSHFCVPSFEPFFGRYSVEEPPVRRYSYFVFWMLLYETYFSYNKSDGFPFYSKGGDDALEANGNDERQGW